MAEGASSTEVNIQQKPTLKRPLRGRTPSIIPEFSRGIGLENRKTDLSDCEKWSRELEDIKLDGTGKFGKESVRKAKDIMSRLHKSKSVFGESFKSGNIEDIESSLGILDRVHNRFHASTVDGQMLKNVRNILLSGRVAIVNNIENLGKLMEGEDVSLQSKKTILGAVNSLFRLGGFFTNEKIPAEFKMKHLEEIAEGMVRQQAGLSVDDSFIRKSMFSLLYASSNRETVLLVSFIEKLFANSDSKLRDIYHSNFFNALREGPRLDYAGESVKSIVRNFLSRQVGEANSGKIIKNWQQAWLVKGFGNGESLGRNLSSLYNLELARPGIGRVLFEQFGISDFGRYPQELLIAQYDEANKKDDVPYGIIINPVDDHNGAFYGSTETFQKLYSQIKDRYRIKVWEVKNLKELVHAINDSRHRYGPISFAIIGGHGTEKSINFGKPYGKELRDRHEELLQEDLRRRGAGSIGLAFTKNPTIILNSCSTGALGGIGQEISKMGAKIIAPPEPISILNIESSIDLNGKVDFRVEYGGDSPPPQIYKEGVLQE